MSTPTASSRPLHAARRWHLRLRQGVLHRWLGELGPGIVTGASDDDPSGIATYSAAGALTGYRFLWTALLTLPMMAAIQDMCARIGLVTGHGLAGTLRLRFPRPVVLAAVSLLFVANTFNVGSDIAAIAAAITLLVPLPIRVLVAPLGGGLVALQILAPYRIISRVFKWLTLAVLAYVVTAFIVRPDVRAVLAGTFIPRLSLSGADIGIFVAILGTTISPYLFFWQTSQEVEERPQEESAAVAPERVHTVDRDVFFGMLYAVGAMFFLILTTGATLHTAGITGIASAADAAAALKPLAGPLAGVVFAVGIIGTGILAIPILTGSVAYAFAECFDWTEGLNTHLREAWRFYAVIGVGTLIGVGLTLVGIDPIRALIWTAQLNGITAPPLMLLILILCNDRDLMGPYTNSVAKNIVAGAAILLMTAAVIALFAVGG